MASFRKRGKKWYAEVRRKGHEPRFGTFDTKAAAQAWATEVEAELLTTKKGKIPNKPFSALLEKYAEEVSPKKDGARWEVIRMNAIGKMDIGKVMLHELDSKHVAAWRDTRLKGDDKHKPVKGSTVNRDWNLLSNVCTYAVDEWKWLHENPFAKAKRPKDSPPRDKLISDREIERLVLALGYDYESAPELVMSRVGAAFLFAIETAMRASEIAGLTWDVVNLETRVAKIARSKTDAGKRDVPLSTEAVRILKQLPDHPNVFNLSADQIDANFREGKKRAIIDDIVFHDTRHLAITRLSKKLDVLALARMVGHKDIRELMTYYNEPAESMADKLR